MKIKNSKIKYIIYSTLFALIAAFLLLSENGLIKYWQLKNEIAKYRLQIDSAKTKIARLESEIDSLKNSLFKIEKVAREKYNIKKKGEKVIQFKEQE
jgi:cell division protein FtsB